MRISDLRFLLAIFLPLLTLNTLVNQPEIAGVATLVVWFAIAGLDVLLPNNSPAPSASPSSWSDAYFRWLLRLFVPLQMALIAVGAWAAMHADWLTVLGLAFSVGFITGSQGHHLRA
ncbi:MAG: hypothetical protein HC765_12405 [Brachymonas sp.]|nr:hypothetical protein [Brachymonas sp.]